MARHNVAALAIVLLLVVVGSAAASVTVQTAPREAYSITVPPGRIGDEVFYGAFHRNSSDEPWQPAPGESYRVEQATEVQDKTGRVRPAVRVATRIESSSFSLEPLPVVGSADYKVWVFLDLTTRDAVMGRMLIGASGSVEPLGLPAYTYVGGFDLFGPQFALSNPYAYPIIGDVPRTFAYQNTTFRVGDALDVGATHQFDREWVLRLAGAHLTALAVTVEGRGRVDDTEAVVIRTTGCLDLRLAENDKLLQGYWGGSRPNRENRTVPFLHATVPFRGTVCFEIDDWLSSASPYPLAREERLRIDGARESHLLHAVARYNPGRGAIPWTEPSPTSEPVEAKSTLERTPAGQHFPSHGSAQWPEYPLTAARAAVLNDPTLVGLRQWLNKHPTALLVGAEWTPYNSRCHSATRWEAVSNLPSWQLTFGVPTGEYYTVLANRIGGQVAQNCELGPAVGKPFDPAHMPDRPPTFGAILHRWHELAGPDSPRPDWFFWGAVRSCESAHEVRAATELWACDPQTPASVWLWRPAVQWDTAWLARTNPSVAAAGPYTAYQWLQVDMTTGNLQSYHNAGEARVATALLQSEFLTEPPATSKNGQPTYGTAPNLLWLGATGAAALLAAVLLTLPLLKYHGAQLAWMIPGYAKLRRSDILNNRLRSEIHQIILADPGVSPPEVARLVTASWTTIVYHLQVLERNGLVSSLLDGRHKRFFPSGGVDWTKRGRIAALRNGRTQAVYDLIREEPGIHQRRLARRMGFSVPAAQWHAKRLLAAGLVATERSGRRVRLYVAAEAEVPLPAPARSPAG